MKWECLRGDIEMKSVLDSDSDMVGGGIEVSKNLEILQASFKYGPSLHVGLFRRRQTHCFGGQFNRKIEKSIEFEIQFCN